LSLGIGFVVYGSLYHKLEVTEEEEIEIEIAVPPTFGPRGMPQGGAPGSPPFAGPAPYARPPFLGKLKEKIYIANEESEATLIEEVTVGGVTLLAGILQRTYSGDRPSLCPT
jgi:hypothetical protein